MENFLFMQKIIITLERLRLFSFRSLYFSTLFLYFFTFVSGQNSTTEFSKQFIKKYLNFLGSDLLEGRGTGQLGGNLSAKFSGLKFDEFNLKPGGDNNTFYQQIPMHSSKPVKGSRLTLFRNNNPIELNLFEDYLLYKTGEQTFLPMPTEMVFAGYGINAPEFDYNDFSGINVEGKIAVVLEGEPLSDDTKYFDGEVPTIYSYSESKLRNVISRGAAGLIILPVDSVLSSKTWDASVQKFSFEDIRLPFSASGKLSLILHPRNIPYFFENSGKSFEHILKMHYSHRMESFDLKTSVSFKGKFIEKEFFSQNIIGLIDGNHPELKNEYIIISAHYDHLGIGPPINGDSIYNGVFDNAAGCAALLELSRVFSLNRYQLKRSLIFILTTGEENGLLGSNYYVNNPKVPLYKTIANVNIDGIASYDRFKSIIGSGSEYSTLENFLEETANEMKLKTTKIPQQFNNWESFNRSDQIEFAKAGIPALLILEGTDYENIKSEKGINRMIEYGSNIYHTPYDDLSQQINYDAFIQHTELLYKFISRLANSDKTPEWKKGSPFINARLRTIAEKK